jgi:hypothetical protein
VRLSLVLWVGGLVCASACGSENLMSGSVGRGGSGGGGSTIDAGGPGDAQPSTVPPCACDSQAADCQSLLASQCLGSHCPPSFDDAMLVENWSLAPDGDPAPGRAQGIYALDADGSRFFSLQGGGRDISTFGFDAQGHLLAVITFDITSGPGDVVCSVPNLQSSPAEWDCLMLSNPPPAGTFKYPSGQYNGFEPPCEIDANGRWFMAGMDQTN